jgi:hypothetical protein
MSWSSDWSQVKRAFLDRSDAAFRILNAFEWNAPVEELLDACRINLMHDAHGRVPQSRKVERVGTTPTLCVGKLHSDSFRLIRVEKGRPVVAGYNGDQEAPIPVPRGRRAPLSLTFAPANNGRHERVKATITNELNESFADARVRFTMPRGIYKVDGGAIFQQFDSHDGKVTIVDVNVAVEPAGRNVIDIGP